MPVKEFYLLGEKQADTVSIEIEHSQTIENLRKVVAGQFYIVDPESISFQTSKEGLGEIEDILDADEAIAIAIDGHSVRDPPGPDGVPVAGNYYEIFPDHLANHQRLFRRYGPLIKTNNYGAINYLTNDPRIATLVFAESDFFTKNIIPNHPLFAIKSQAAGVFLGDTDNESWRIVHKFLPPALGPKAVRHYAPAMQKTLQKAFEVFDYFDENEEAWNVYNYMLKLGSQAVGRLMLGLDMHNFDAPDAPLHKIVALIAEALSLNKKISSRGPWYSSLPFGDPKKLRDCQHGIEEILDDAIASCVGSGVEDLQLQDAALKASCVIDYAVRAVDSKGERLPETNLRAAVQVATGAGFTTTSSLLSWLIYSLVQYPGNQERILQELVDHDINDETQWNSDLTDKLPFVTAFIKEVQRLHNPSFQPGRTTKQPCILPGGYKLPANAIVIPALHHIHNNPEVWSDPTRFDPNRWLPRPGDDNKESEADKVIKEKGKAAYIPFAMGPRMCIGFNFALQEVKIFLPMLVWRYQFERFRQDGAHQEENPLGKYTEETAASQEVAYDPMFQLIRPVNLYVRAIKRTNRPVKSI